MLTPPEANDTLLVDQIPGNQVWFFIEFGAESAAKAYVDRVPDEFRWHIEHQFSQTDLDFFCRYYRP